MGKRTFLLWALISFTSVAGSYAGLVATGPGTYAFNNIIEVEFAKGVAVQPVAEGNAVAKVGVPSFDALCDIYGVESVAPLFPGADPLADVDLSRFYLVTFAQDQADILAVIEAFRKDPNLDYAGLSPVTQVTFEPNDPTFPLQWGLKHFEDHDIDADGAWETVKGDVNLCVAIADTGVDWEHPDLGANVWYNLAEKNGTPGVDDDGNGYVDDDKGWDWVTGVSGVSGEDCSTPDNNPMDFNGHGTHCAGIASAVTNNGVGVAGVAFNTKVMCLRVGWSGMSGSEEVGYIGMSFAASAMRYAADKGAVAINCSWGSSSSGGMSSAFSYALSKNVLVCSAAGNNNSSSNSGYWLCQQPQTLAVAATCGLDTRASFSNYGTWVDVCAPGQSIVSTYRHHYGEHTYAYLSGTSMACPHVVGLAALIKTKNPGWGWAEIRDKITSTCDNIDALNPGYVGMLGSGRINAKRAVSDVGVELLSFTARPHGDGVAVKWSAREQNHAGYNLYRRPAGSENYSLLNDGMIKGRSPYDYADLEGRPGVTYEYVLEAVDTQGYATTFGPVRTDFPGKTEPTSYALVGPWPNPTRDVLNAAYTLPRGHEGRVHVSLYDLSGRRVQDLDGGVSCGTHRVTLNVGGLAPGVYILKLDAGAYSAAKRVAITK